MKSIPTPYLSNKEFLFTREWFYDGLLVLPAFVCLVYSYNYHTFWLLYDIIALILLCRYLVSPKRILSTTQSWTLTLTLCYFFMLITWSGQWLSGILSVWDTFKHLIYFHLLLTINETNNNDRNQRLSAIIYSFIKIAFFIQVIAVAIQYKLGTHFDNVAGTFGNGGSHAIGYISLLFIVASITFHKEKLYLIVTLFIITLINNASENIGFFVLAPLVLIEIASLIRVKHKVLYLFIFSFIFLLWFFSQNIYLSIHSFANNTILKRSLNLIDVNRYSEIERESRGFYMFLSATLGGWFGQGPGAYSNIYQMEGFKFNSLVFRQINISEATHLIAESGFFGLIMTISVYIVFIFNFFHKTISKYAMSFLFISMIFYSSVLGNESQTLMVLLMFYFIRIQETNANRSFPTNNLPV